MSSSIAYNVACLSVVQIDTYFENDLMRSLEIYRQSSPESNKTIKEDFDAVQHLVNDLLLCLSIWSELYCYLYSEESPILYYFCKAKDWRGSYVWSCVSLCVCACVRVCMCLSKANLEYY